MLMIIFLSAVFLATMIFIFVKHGTKDVPFIILSCIMCFALAGGITAIASNAVKKTTTVENFDINIVRNSSGITVFFKDGDNLQDLFKVKIDNLAISGDKMYIKKTTRASPPSIWVWQESDSTYTLVVPEAR
jgi:hypothetical protein